MMALKVKCHIDWKEKKRNGNLSNFTNDIIQEAVIKTIPKKKKYKKAKWLSAEYLQIAVKRREAKGKGEKERYTQLSESSKE